MHEVVADNALIIQGDGSVNLILSPLLSGFVNALIVTIKLPTDPVVVEVGMSEAVVPPSTPTVIADREAFVHSSRRTPLDVYD